MRTTKFRSAARAPWRRRYVDAGKKVELVEYKGAYHRFDRGPAGSVSRSAYTYRRDDAAAADAFARTVRWLKEHLR